MQRKWTTRGVTIEITRNRRDRWKDSIEASCKRRLKGLSSTIEKKKSFITITSIFTNNKYILNKIN